MDIYGAMEFDESWYTPPIIPRGATHEDTINSVRSVQESLTWAADVARSTYKSD